MKPVAIIGAGITDLTTRQIWLICRWHERRTHFALHRFGGAHSNGQVARLADEPDCSRHFGGVDLCRSAGISAQSRTLARHHGFGIFAAAEK